MTPGRSCPVAYRYPPSTFERPADLGAETIYVVGGLYGNMPALNAILELAAAEPITPLLVFNGDFNWFNIDAGTFETLNGEVLKHIALRGNVETELAAGADDAGCGCAYPEYVDDADVERSNQIMRALRRTAAEFPALASTVSALPMTAVAEVGGQRIGIVHGDAESLAGWRFAHDSLHEPANVEWLHQVCESARLAGFACSHTCLPTFRQFTRHRAGADGPHFVINNGAAGMPNFSHTQYGLITRLSVHPAGDGLAQYGDVFGGVHVDALPVHYDAAQFERAFLANWPEGSPAHQAYFNRIRRGPAYAAPHALGLVRAPSVCA
ncbi:MAG: metallophosphoesterase [Betaproteobacteria bacterium]